MAGTLVVSVLDTDGQNGCIGLTDLKSQIGGKRGLSHWPPSLAYFSAGRARHLNILSFQLILTMK